MKASKKFVFSKHFWWKTITASIVCLCGLSAPCEAAPAVKVTGKICVEVKGRWAGYFYCDGPRDSTLYYEMCGGPEDKFEGERVNSTGSASPGKLFRTAPWLAGRQEIPLAGGFHYLTDPSAIVVKAGPCEKIAPSCPANLAPSEWTVYGYGGNCPITQPCPPNPLEPTKSQDRWASNGACYICPEGQIWQDDGKGKRGCKPRCEGLRGRGLAACSSCDMSGGIACRCNNDPDPELCACIANGGGAACRCNRFTNLEEKQACFCASGIGGDACNDTTPTKCTGRTPFRWKSDNKCRSCAEKVFVGRGGRCRNGTNTVVLPRLDAIGDALNPFFTADEIKILLRVPAELRKMRDAIEASKDQVDKVRTLYKSVVDDMNDRLDATEKYFSERVDTSYHLGMQAYLTIRLGEGPAKLIGDWYELKDIPGSFFTGTFDNFTGIISGALGFKYNAYLDSNKDFYNNKEGRALGNRLLAENPNLVNLSDEELMKYTAEKAIELVRVTESDWPSGQKYGIVIDSKDTDLPRFDEQNDLVVDMLIEVWEGMSNVGDASVSIARAIVRLFTYGDATKFE